MGARDPSASIVDWEPERSVSPYCRDKGWVCNETASHFAKEIAMETAGLTPLVGWLVDWVYYH